MSGDPDDPERPDGPSAAATSGVDGDDSDAPLSELARRVSDRRRDRESGVSAESPDLDSEAGSGDGDDPFRRMSVAEIDEESLWSSLEDDAEPTVTVGSPESAGADPDKAERAAEPSEHVVSKTDYCQKCPHLHEPPELACTHEGTRIVAVEDTEHFRVRNCPMVDD